MYGNRRRRKKTRSAGFIPPAMMVLMIFVAVFAILLMVFAIVRGREDRARQNQTEAALPRPAAEETVRLEEERPLGPELCFEVA